MLSKHFIVRRDVWTEHTIVTEERVPLASGTVELEIDRFGLTTNNATYAALGDSFSYWNFFPRREAGWGSVPVWGFASVSRSEHPDVAIGQRFYGYFPMSTHLIVQPHKVDGSGFLDGAEHRRPLSNVYNHYRLTTTDPNYRPDTEPQQVILRPLFGTSFFLTDFLQAEGFFGAGQLLFSSASSKTAYGTAFLLKRQSPRDCELVGMTSRRNVDFVTRLGLYDRVITYDDVASLSPSRKAVYIDFAGSRATRAVVHRHFGDALAHSSAIGATHAGALETKGEPLPGPPPTLFFAPARIKQRAEDWSPAVMWQRVAEAWNAFLVPILEPSRGWLRIESGRGDEAVKQHYDAIVRGESAPEEGRVVSLMP
ncbi:DUF2855 family protein [Pendulispora rubella]|uniref:DUF2855 family protein n=1 Tax=Pendulispora rubella TaxID=2741070 RepID=A0ABZ2LBY5_9BACT